MKQVAKVGIIHKGQMLMGVRQDNGKWTEPGGHLEGKESPVQGALREVQEETGIRLSTSDLLHLGSKVVTTPKGEKLNVHAFKAELNKKPETRVDQDPDAEVFGWNWVPVGQKGPPESIQKNMHVPPKYNVMHLFMGFRKAAFEKAARGSLLKRLTPHLDDVRWLVGDVPNQVAQNIPKKDEK